MICNFLLVDMVLQNPIVLGINSLNESQNALSFWDFFCKDLGIYEIIGRDNPEESFASIQKISH